MNHSTRIGFAAVAIFLGGALAACQTGTVRHGTWGSVNRWYDSPSDASAPWGWGSKDWAPRATEGLLGVFHGTVPCADCAGIRTQISLYDDYSGAHRRYRLIETYLGTQDGDRTTVSEGPWDFERGFEDEPDAVVYVVEPDKPALTRRFLKLDADHIEMVDRAGQRIDSELDCTLVRLGR